MKQLFEIGDKVTITNFSSGNSVIPEIEGSIESEISNGEYKVKINNEIVKISISMIKQFNDILKNHELFVTTNGEKGKLANLSNVDLSGVNLSNKNLSYAIFHWANLRGAVFSNTNLQHTDFLKTNLSYADLNNANLAHANLNESDLSYASLLKANLVSAYLRETILNKADLINAVMIHVDLRDSNVQDADLEEANLQYANLENIDLSYTNLTKANLSYANLKLADLSYAKLFDSYFIGADLSEANLYYSKSSKANFSNANLVDAIFEGANLTSANFSESDLTEADLNLADFSESNLSNADLWGVFAKEANLTKANLSYTNLKLADLTDAIFISADLQNANLRSSDLSRTNFHKANLTNANLSNATLDETYLEEAIFSNTIIEKDSKPKFLKEVERKEKNETELFPLNKFKKGELGVCVHNYEQIKQVQTVSGIPLNVKLNIFFLDNENDGVIIGFNEKENSLEFLEKEDMEIMEASLFNKSCALDILNNSMPKSPLEQYYLVSALAPITQINDGQKIATIVQRIDDIEVAERIYSCTKKAYQKTEDTISLEAIVSETVDAYCRGCVNLEDIEKMHPLELITNAIEHFHAFSKEDVCKEIPGIEL